MTKSTRSATILMLSLGMLLLAGTSRAQTRPPIVEQLAKTYGLDSFGQLDAIRYTFNLELPDLKVNLSRTWTWEPKTGQVTYESKDKDGKPVKVTYHRSQLNSAQRQLLVYFPIPCLLGHQRHCDSQGHAKIAAGKGFGEAGVGEISSGGWRLHAGRYVGSFPRVGWSS